VNWFDAVSAGFEVSAGILTWMNVKILLKHKVVRGVYWPATAVFTAWGGWNCIWYPHLQQWLSFSGGLFITVANATWIYWVLRFKQNRPEDHGA
jgi:hypothetical protein